MSVLGAVLVGGKSRRMGSPKALLQVDGVPMAGRVANAMASAGIARIVAVGPAELTAGLDRLADEHPGEGPLGGVLTALHAAAGDDVLVVACDLPWIDAVALDALLAADAREVDVVVAWSDRLEPLCARWRPTSVATVERCFAAGERSVHRAIDALRSQSVAVPTSVLLNVNTPSDLRRRPTTE